VPPQLVSSVCANWFEMDSSSKEAQQRKKLNDLRLRRSNGGIIVGKPFTVYAADLFCKFSR